MTETITYKTLEPGDMPPGPWQDEPDKKQWQDQATGLPCLIVRNLKLGHLCGYVGVDESHPLHGADDDSELVLDIEVHGGVTFAKGCNKDADESTSVCHVPSPGEPDNVWWFGFDCAHLDDLSPIMRETLREIMPSGTTSQDDDTYRDFAYVEAECASLARQLADMA